MIYNTLGQIETKLYNNDYCYLLRIYISCASY